MAMVRLRMVGVLYRMIGGYRGGLGCYQLATEFCGIHWLIKEGGLWALG